MPRGRVYGGQGGDERRAERRAQLIEAGLDMLGGGEAVSVRGVCKKSGLTTRYFYESFADRSALENAVYDHVVEVLAGNAWDAVAPVDDEKAAVRAGIESIVRDVAADPRLGHVMFSASPALQVFAQRRIESTRMFAGLVTRKAADFYDVEQPGLDLVAHFVVGGFAQALTAWLTGTVELDESDVVDTCTELLLSLAPATGSL
ncbi:TetR/AcrR family transcriptional regulator [Rhodococcus sp. HNM0569]|nr:TetR/AcrR family transcriptional regulator [Rhodococcus sp. HNM0569]